MSKMVWGVSTVAPVDGRELMTLVHTECGTDRSTKAVVGKATSCSCGALEVMLDEDGRAQVVKRPPGGQVTT